MQIRLLEVILLIGYVSCQNGFSEQDLLRLQQMSSNDGQIETITSYSTNVVQRDPIRNEHSVSTVSVQYHLSDESQNNEDIDRAGRRKIFHIKNPFQRQLNQNKEHQTNNFNSQDIETGASNQYAAVQYSLPPEEFLQQMRAESQYIPQYSTPAPQISYTVTPQPQYQYNVNPQGNYEGTQASQEYKSNNANSLQSYLELSNGYSSEHGQSTPSPNPSYLSTSLPNNQYVGTPANSPSYVSSASPLYLSSSSSIPQYVSSPITLFQTGSPDYGNRVTSSSNSVNYDNNDQNKNIQIDHYDNAGNGIRYPINVQNQYQNLVSSTTQAPPSSTSYPDPTRDAWQNAMNTGVNSLSKSLQEVSMMTQYQNSLQSNNNQQDARQEQNYEHSNNDRISNNMASANNMYLNYAPPEYPGYTNVKTSTQDREQEPSQREMYSHGDYGWNLSNKKTLNADEGYNTGSYVGYRPHTAALQSEGTYQNSNYQVEQHKPQQSSYVYNQRITSDPISQNSKNENIEAQEFAKAVAKAQENNIKYQQTGRNHDSYYLNNYSQNYNSGNGGHPNFQSQPNIVSTFYGNSDKQKTRYISDNSNSNQYIYNNSPGELITASPFYYSNSRDGNFELKTKQPFDHAKALKNIVPIDVSNVVQNSEAALKAIASLNNNRFNIQSYPKEQIEQSLKQAYRPLTDAYYKDKNTGYGFNIKTKSEETSGSSNDAKQIENNIAQYNRYHHQDPSFHQLFLSDTKRYGESPSNQVNYLSQSTNSYNENLQQPNNIQQAIQRPQQQASDIASILKLNDIPYRLTQNLNSDALKMHNNNFDQGSIPQPIPTRINQNVGSHQLDVTNSILSKLLSKHTNLNYNRLNEIDPQTGGPVSNIRGFRVANPYNVDLKLVSEMLKGKPAVDETHMISLRDQFNKPLNLDVSSLQQFILKNDNFGNISPLTDGISAIGNSYNDPYNGGRYPYQGIKYSRSQEEEESLPIAESSNTHPIGAVMEQDESSNVREVDEDSDLTAQGDEDSSSNFDKGRPKALYNNREHRLSSNHRHQNLLTPGRHLYQRKYPKHGMGEPYPLLKPPPQHLSRNKGVQSKDRRSRRRRITKPKISRMLKTDPVFESGSNRLETEAESSVPILLKPPPPVAEDKSDVVGEKSRS